MNEKVIKLKKELGYNISQNENLSRYSWFNLGGPAKILFKPKNKEEIIKFLNYLEDKKEIFCLGAGSNTLFRDGGFKGVIIKLSSKFSFINLLDNNILEVGAATLDKTLSNYAAKNGLGGLEFLSCIPGSIGGAIVMNSGCYGDEISNHLISLKGLDFKGKEIEIDRNQIEFFYRGTSLPRDLIILSAKFKCNNEKKENINNKINKYIAQKKKAQPSQVKTCGSTFKNPEKLKAWKLIKDSGCSEITVGKASISKKHSNFFINDGGASSGDIEKLIKTVQNKVLEKYKVNLDLEIKLIGESK